MKKLLSILFLALFVAAGVPLRAEEPAAGATAGEQAAPAKKPMKKKHKARKSRKARKAKKAKAAEGTTDAGAGAGAGAEAGH